MEQVKRMLSRFQVQARVGERAMEYYRLAEVKCQGGVGGATSTGLALICIEIACTQLGEPFDKRQAQKLSGMKPKAYVSACQTVERLLNVTSQVSLRDLAIKFDCLEVEDLAREVERSYKAHAEKKYTTSQKEAMDFSKPVYATAALYTACKLLKIRCDKSKFQTAAMCTRSVFQNILEEMNKCAPKNIDEFRGRKKRKQDADNDSSETGRLEDQAATLQTVSGPKPKRAQREFLHSRIQSNPYSKEYKEWRERIIREARAKLDGSHAKERHKCQAASQVAESCSESEDMHQTETRESRKRTLRKKCVLELVPFEQGL